MCFLKAIYLIKNLIIEHQSFLFLVKGLQLMLISCLNPQELANYLTFLIIKIYSLIDALKKINSHELILGLNYDCFI